MVVAIFFECFEGQYHAYSGDFSYNGDAVRLK